MIATYWRDRPLLENGEAPDSAPKVYGWPADRQRAAALNEIHARPFPAIQAPRALIQLVFVNGDDTQGNAGPRVPYHGASWDQGDLRCEKHSEFSTYLWNASLDGSDDAPSGRDPFREGFTPPGPVLSGSRLDIFTYSDETAALVDRFDASTRCHSSVEHGLAEIVTDFCQDENGLTRMMILDRGLTPERLSASAHLHSAFSRSRPIARWRFSTCLSCRKPCRFCNGLRPDSPPSPGVYVEACVSTARRL
ncbi:DUF3422 family protein [Kozakia baliensis]|uniref:DUF3422 family protein n=1 Tax=Kozakia baliensis TaxID=153496 RepID=UPI003570E481